MVIIRINNRSVKVPNGYRLLKDNVKMKASDKILYIPKGIWIDVKTAPIEEPDKTHTPGDLMFAAVIRREGLLNKHIFKEDGLYVEDEPTFGIKRIKPDAAFIQEQLNNIVKNMNRKVVYPKEKLGELKWNDVFTCWVFPQGTPRNEGRYLSILLLRLEEEFPGYTFEQAKIKATKMCSDVKHVKQYIHTIKVNGPESFVIKATSEIYEPPHKTIVLVGIALTLEKKRIVQKH